VSGKAYPLDRSDKFRYKVAQIAAKMQGLVDRKRGGAGRWKSESVKLCWCDRFV